jgi:hypothetical protein
MQRPEKQDNYTRITSRSSATWKKESGTGLGRGTPNLRQNGLPAHSATIRSPSC